jgi:hypothetical protein
MVLRVAFAHTCYQKTLQHKQKFVRVFLFCFRYLYLFKHRSYREARQSAQYIYVLITKLICF